MNVFVVTVTYGDRHAFVRKLIDRCIKENVTKIIVVDNGSYLESQKKLDNFVTSSSSTVRIISLPENSGSAGGFTKGIKAACEDPECEFIWLLDDDNMPADNSLKALKDFWSTISFPDKEKKIGLLAYRESRHIYKKALTMADPSIVVGRKNNFYGIHLKEIISRAWHSFASRIGLTHTSDSIEHLPGSGIVDVAPYGGFFFHKELINTIGYPDEQFFLYYDDHDWSYRITRNGGKIFLVTSSIIEEQERSWNIEKKHNMFALLRNTTNFRVYYSVRNRIYFIRKYLLTNICVYTIHKYIFIALVVLLVPKKIFIVMKAINDAEHGRLGKRNDVGI